jgi:dienelactone hydrolase
MRTTAIAGLATLVLAAGCSQFDPDPAPILIHARFDPDAKVIPMPSNALRDDVAGRLDLPADDADLTPAEHELYTYLNTLDGWSSASAATVDFTGPIDPASVRPDTLSVWKWSDPPELVTDVAISITGADDPDHPSRITIDPPRYGWERGATYVVALRGGERGVIGADGERVECDAAFYFLRQTERLDTPEHERAFPGDTAAERHEQAVEAEEVRAELVPAFDFFAGRGVPRAEIAALWQFTITRRVELAMDKVSQRMPLPIQLLLDPDTGLVDLPEAAWDTEVEREAKRRLRTYDGFATSANLLFELTGTVDASTVTADTVELWHLTDPPVQIDAEVELMADRTHVIVRPARLLSERARYAVVATDGVRDDSGQPIIAMPAGVLIGAVAEVATTDGASTVDAVAGHDARKLEAARAMLRPMWTRRDRGGVVAAWPFQTQTILPRLLSVVATAERLGIARDPVVTEYRTPAQAILDFPLGIGSMFDTQRVVEGTIASPYYLDATTRAWKPDGSYSIEPVAFTAIVPEGVSGSAPIPVVIFGHGVMTERRFVLAIGDALSRRGIASIAIDLPFHGTRTQCIQGGPISVVDPTTGDLTSLPPCKAGSTCMANGVCSGGTADDNSQLSSWPVLGYPIASGAAFLEIDHIANTKDHFDQALIDLGALSRSLAGGNWQGVFGAPVDPDRIYYAGQSLGGILGATFLAAEPRIHRAVLNVPGADLVDMFDDSTWFGPQVAGFFTREGIEAGSYEAERFLDVARWFVDAVDPQNLGPATGARELFLQMATLDFIIPNAYTETLEAVTGAPRRDYLAEHGFLVIPIEPAYLPGTSDLAEFLETGVTP